MDILIADDDPISRLMLSCALTNLGHTVAEAANGRDALAQWQRRRQPLVVSDWMMPDLDGLGLARAVRGEQGPGFTYIVLLTARTGKANHLEAMAAGADDFMSKPFDPDQLSARVRVAERILGLHENLRTANAELEQCVVARTAELQEALRVKSEFLSRASHELRTPLNHILGFAQLLELEPLEAAQHDNVAEILRSGAELLALIDRILAVSKNEPEDLTFAQGQSVR